MLIYVTTNAVENTSLKYAETNITLCISDEYYSTQYKLRYLLNTFTGSLIERAGFPLDEAQEVPLT